MRGSPRVSIGLPVYNGERYLGQALESLLSQDYTNIELIISDNGSTDGTEKICREYASKDSRIQYRHHEVNIGVIENFNRVARLASGKYFMWAADHDRWQPTFISRCVEVLENDASVVLCYPLAVWMDCAGRLGDVISPFLDTRGLRASSRLRVVIWEFDYFYQIYGVMRLTTLKATGLFRDTIGPDVLLLAELSLLGEFHCVSERLFSLRRMPDYGSWQSYLGKMKVKLTRWSPIRLFCKMIYYHLAVIAIHGRGFFERVFLMISVMACMVSKHRWIVRGLLAAAASNAPNGQIDCGKD